MADERSIKQEIQNLNSLEMLTKAYEEIASIRMKKARGEVLSRRDFIKDINKVFDEVRASYARQVEKFAKKRGKEGEERLTFLAHNGRTVAVFLSANTGLYGDIVRKTFNQFIRVVRKEDLEVTLIGKYGLSLFLQEEPNRPYTYFDLPDYNVLSRQLVEIVKHIVQYEEIRVFYGKFVNVLSQVVTSYSISAEIRSVEKKNDQQNLYIFEPTLENILIFFEKEIFASFFEQAVEESELAKFASRVIAMDKASENIKDHLEDLRKEKLMAYHRAINQRQLNSLSSLYTKVSR